MGVVRNIAGRLWETWQALSPGHRVILVLLALLTVASVMGVILWQRMPEHRILFSGLSSTQCADISKALEEAGIPAQITSDSHGIRVPKSRVQEARMVAANKGLPAESNDGLQMFRKPKLGMTPFAEKVTYIDALQTELASTISSLDAVNDARVHLALPEEKVFKDNSEEASASVVVQTNPGQQVDKRQVAGISHLIASAVERVEAEDVTVTDGKGNVLGGSGRKTGSAFAGSQWDNRQKVERDLAQNAETMLARVLGPNNAEVRVNAEMEFHDSTKRSETYDADNQVLKSEHIEEEETTGGGSRVGGPVGSDQQGDEQPSSGQGTAQSSSTEEIETEYLVGKTVTESKKMGADITQLSVAAVVDRGDKEKGKKSKGGAEGKKPSLEEIKQIIRRAVGYEEARGDSLTVTEADMSGPALKPPEDSSGMLPDWAFRLARYGAVVAVAGICLLIAVKALKNGSEQQMPDYEVELLPESEEDDGRSREEIAWEQVTHFVEERPEETGRLLEAWIQSERQT